MVAGIFLSIGYTPVKHQKGGVRVFQQAMNLNFEILQKNRYLNEIENSLPVHGVYASSLAVGLIEENLFF